MKHIIRFRWLIAIAWIAVAAGLFIFSPNLQELVREKGQISLPADSPSQEASALLEEMSGDSSGDTTSAVLVFHDDDGLDQSEKQEVSKAIDQLQENKDKLGLSNILAFTKDPKIAEQTVSDDETTILVPFNLSLADQEIGESREKINQTVENNKVKHHLTGEDYIQLDITKNSEEGLKRTEFITVGLILVILFIVFKSFVAPFIPLLTVGISYLAAQGVVSILADSVGFPLSTFTQIFMVAVMFGIGTDYCILLISRFKEEIAHHESIKNAVLATYKSAGKTIFFAGLAVLVGFSTIGLSTFSLYQSAVAVAVGVAVVLIAITTLVPFFLVVLGKKLFWPFDKNVSHKESKLYKSAGLFAWGRPVIALLIVAAVTVPFLLTYDGDKSYNSLAEIGDEYGSVKGFNWIADSFGPGQTMPTTVVLETDKPINSVKEYQDIATISSAIAQMDGVEQVRSATRPAGEIVEKFLVKNQTEQLADSINKSTKGIKEIQTGLAKSSEQLKVTSTKQGAGQTGGAQATALAKMQAQLNKLSAQLNKSSVGLKKINEGLSGIESYLEDFYANGSNPTVVIPKKAVESEAFLAGTKPYLSDDKTITKFEVVLKNNPYSSEAIAMVDKIDDTVNDAKDGTVFADSHPKLGGISSTNNDLQNISDEDYSRTVTLMIIGLFIVLVIMLRSIIIPIYLIGSLILTYFTSLGVTELIFVNILGYDGLSWAIPFFGFVMLMALGIDYSIFLMDRFKEYTKVPVKEALINSMKNMGTVIISAAVILGGTFGAMLPSGVLSLLEIATLVLTGLFLYAFIMLPLFIPVMVRLFGKINWWPFRR